MYIHIYLCINIYICIYIYVYIYICVCIYIYMYTSTYLYIYIDIIQGYNISIHIYILYIHFLYTHIYTITYIRGSLPTQPPADANLLHNILLACLWSNLYYIHAHVTCVISIIFLHKYTISHTYADHCQHHRQQSLLLQIRFLLHVCIQNNISFMRIYTCCNHYIHTHIFTYACVRMYVYVYIYIHIHVCMCV